MVKIEKDLDRDRIDSGVCETIPTQPIKFIRTEVEGFGNIDLTACSALTPEGKCTRNLEDCCRSPFATSSQIRLLRSYAIGEWSTE